MKHDATPTMAVFITSEPKDEILKLCSFKPYEQQRMEKGFRVIIDFCRRKESEKILQILTRIVEMS